MTTSFGFSRYADRGAMAGWIQMMATLMLASIISIIAYRIFLHPLRVYPGPKLYAISSLPRSWQIIMGNEFQLLYNLHMKYGPIVRTSPNELSFVDSQAWKDIYGHHKAGKGDFVKDSTFFDPPLNGVPDILRGGDSAGHSRLRKVFSHSFSDRALKNQEPLLKEHINKLIKNLKAIAMSDGPKVDLVKYFNFATFDIIADLTFSEPLGLLDGNDYNDWVRSIVFHIRIMTIFRVLKGYEKLFKVMKWLMPASVAEGRNKVWNYAKTRVDRRLERGITKPDIWAEMMRRDASVSVDDMYSNAEVFMGAGTETTATLLSGLTYYLLTNSDKMQKLKAEIHASCSLDENISVEKLQSLKYLQACMDEAFRLYPPAAVGLTRVTPQEGAYICDQWVAGGTKVSIPAAAAYRLPSNFTRPLEFIPERWIDTDGEFASDNRSIVQPFSYGPRNCIGRNLALHEIRLIMTLLLRNFDFTLTPESTNWVGIQKVFTVWEKIPLICELVAVEA